MPSHRSQLTFFRGYVSANSIHREWVGGLENPSKHAYVSACIFLIISILKAGAKIKKKNVGFLEAIKNCYSLGRED